MDSRICLSVVALVLVGGAGVAANWPPPAGSAAGKLVKHVRNKPGKAAEGAKFFKGNRLSCVSCHGQPGKGKGGAVGPNLVGVGKRLTREQLMQKVLSPRPESAMPGNLARHFQPDDFANLIAYLESLR